MTTLTFVVRDGEDQGARPDGSTVNWSIRINTLTPLVPKRIGKTTTSISGKSGETRVRGRVFEGTFAIPLVSLAQLPIARDFANSMIYGYGNPFFLDATDGFGIHRAFWGVVTAEVIPMQREGCREWSMSIPFTEIPAP